MLNTRDLENRWFKYKIKSYIPYIIITLSSIVIIVVLSFFINSDEEDKTIILVDKKEAEPQQKYVNQKNKTVNIKIPEEKVKSEALVPTKATLDNNSSNHDKSLKLSPSLNFIKKMQHSSLPYYDNEPAAYHKVKTTKKDPVEEIVEEIQDLTVNEATNVTVEEEVKKITINRRDAADDIKHIIKRFKKNNNPALSLFVAKKYYELGDYHKAYNYALITNQINRDIEASWIVFSKSLVKLNEKEMAIKTLKEYIENSHSSSAKILLDEIVSGKFK